MSETRTEQEAKRRERRKRAAERSRRRHGGRSSVTTKTCGECGRRYITTVTDSALRCALCDPGAA
jgi:hypothetical protein